MAAILKHAVFLSRQLNGSSRLKICLVNNDVSNRINFTRFYHRSRHVSCQLHSRDIYSFNSGKNCTRRDSNFLCFSFAVRNNSSSTQVPDEVLPGLENEIVSTNTENSLKATDYIPEPPLIPEPIDIVESLQVLGEPTFVSLGLGNWTPVGLVERSLEYLHVSFGLPWWLSIVLGTLVIRTLMFPIMVKTQRNAAKMNNNLPQMQLLQMKMTEARKSGNSLEVAKYGHELMTFMKTKGLNPLTNMLWPLAQAPVFISFFFSLRKMANLPVDSLKDGGLWWFSNLTVPDPFYILPIMTSISLFITLEIAADGGIKASNMQVMRYVMRGIPIVILPFTASFPAAVLCYWFTSNTISLVLATLLKMPKARQYFKIEKIINFTPDELPSKKKGFVESVKESISNSRITQEMDDRHRVAALRFRQAGMGPIQKTYPYDPTKQTSSKQ